MSPFIFEPESRPFPRWMGPFSPARGIHSGFRIHRRRLGTWVDYEYGKVFWPVVDCPGARAIVKLVRNEWGGGRVLLLPNGFVVKPLQSDDEVGVRALVGRFQGPIVFERPDLLRFDLSQPGTLNAGDPWPGPTTTGLECAIRSDGSLECKWYHPSAWGQDLVSVILRGPDWSLGAGMRAARLGDTSGRVRITANGHVITNREDRYGSWVAVYVGRIDPGSWADWSIWKQKEEI
jgi:hypothetical protein